MSPVAAEVASAWSPEGDGVVGCVLVRAGCGGAFVGAAEVVEGGAVLGAGALVWEPPQAASTAAAGAISNSRLMVDMLAAGP